jgi:hypothetical protein
VAGVVGATCVGVVGIAGAGAAVVACAGEGAAGAGCVGVCCARATSGVSMNMAVATTIEGRIMVPVVRD